MLRHVWIANGAPTRSALHMRHGRRRRARAAGPRPPPHRPGLPRPPLHLRRRGRDPRQVRRRAHDGPALLHRPRQIERRLLFRRRGESAMSMPLIIFILFFFSFLLFFFPLVQDYGLTRRCGRSSSLLSRSLRACRGSNVEHFWGKGGGDCMVWVCTFRQLTTLEKALGVLRVVRGWIWFMSCCFFLEISIGLDAGSWANICV